MITMAESKKLVMEVLQCFKAVASHNLNKLIVYK